MSTNAYNALTVGLGISVLVALAVSIFSFVLMTVRWKLPERRGHAVRLLFSIAAIPCLVGIQQAILWLVFLPALGREQAVQNDAMRTGQLKESSIVHVGDRVPDFVLTDADGSTFSMISAKGKVVVISFFATWCGPCLLELPHIEKIWKEYGDPKKFHLLVIGREESMDSVRIFRSKNGFSFPIAPDPDRKIYSLFAKELIPRTIVVSPAGVIVYFKAGFDERDLNELSSVLTQQIAGLK
jgi:peroxiredoxin